MAFFDNSNAQNYSAADVEALNKALSAGTGTDSSQFTGGRALIPEDCEQETLNILSCTSIDEVETETSIYPNPASQNITITNVENADIEIVNALGQVVYANKNASGNISIDVRNFTNGTYFVKVNGSVSKINVVK